MNKRKLIQELFGYLSEEGEFESTHEFSHQANIVSNQQGQGLKPENGGKAKTEGEAEGHSGGSPTGADHDHARSIRFHDNKKREDLDLVLASVTRDCFGDSKHDEPSEYAVRKKINKENEAGNYAKERFEGLMLEEDGKYKRKLERYVTKLKGKADGPTLVLEIPLRRPPAHQDQMETLKLSNIVGIDPKPFDPDTYVEHDLLVADKSGSERCTHPATMIRWREVINPDGTTSVESNARFVTWSDESVQLLVGNEVFDVSQQDIQDIQSHLYLRHQKGIFQAQGKILRKMVVTPSSLSSNAHRHLSASVYEKDKKVAKIRRHISDVDPEAIMDPYEKVTKDFHQSSSSSDKLPQAQVSYRTLGKSPYGKMKRKDV